MEGHELTEAQLHADTQAVQGITITGKHSKPTRRVLALNLFSGQITAVSQVEDWRGHLFVGAVVNISNDVKALVFEYDAQDQPVAIHMIDVDGKPEGPGFGGLYFDEEGTLHYAISEHGTAANADGSRLNELWLGAFENMAPPEPQVAPGAGSRKPMPYGPKIHFSDVVEGRDWFFDDVQVCVDLGFISGYSDGTFKPGNDMTRAQVMKIVAKLARLSGLHE